MNQLKTIVVDDESPARRRIKELCEESSEIDLIGEAANGEEALELIKRVDPDLVFLDVQMPFVNGVQIAERLNQNVMIIFVTAHENFALDAFNNDVIDYLLKPFSNQRFYKAITKASNRYKERKSLEFQNKVGQLLNTQKEGRWLSSIRIRQKGLEEEIDVRDILFFRGNGNYVDLVTSGKKYTYRSTMSGLEAQLDSSVFVRIHKSVIVNSHHVIRSRYTGVNNEFEFRMKNGEVLTSGRQYKQVISNFHSKRSL